MMGQQVVMPQVTVPAISIQGVSKAYQTTKGDGVPALSEISLQVPDGEFVAIVGPSGCGKSTLLRLLAGLMAVTAGEVRLRGEPVRGPRREVGFVFQKPVLLPWRTVLQNALLPCEVLRLDVKAYRQRALELLDLIGLSGFADRYPFELSGGMQQRAAIARALVHDPTILLMDEPFGALDAMTREHMNVELQRIWQASHKTICFVTHSIPEAVYLADRVVVLSGRPGQILDVVPVRFPRPRPLEVMNTPEFGTLVTRVRQYFSAKGAVD